MDASFEFLLYIFVTFFQGPSIGYVVVKAHFALDLRNGLLKDAFQIVKRK